MRTPSLSLVSKQNQGTQGTVLDRLSIASAWARNTVALLIGALNPPKRMAHPKPGDDDYALYHRLEGMHDDAR
jgi:hypothetical protein